MRAILLAAGRGSRMGRLTEDRPKCMVALKGKPLLAWQAEALTQAGVTRMAVVSGYKREAIAGVSFEREFHNPRWRQTNMVRSLQCASSWLEEADCIISYTDIFYDAAAAAALIGDDADIALTYDVNFARLWQARQENPLDDLENFRLNPDGTIAEIGGRARAMETIEGQYMGLLKFKPAGWKRISQSVAGLTDGQLDTLDMTSLLSHAIGQGVRVRAVPFAGDWGEVDSPSDLALYES